MWLSGFTTVLAFSLLFPCQPLLTPTETTIEQFFDARDIEDIEYSYALHRRETTDGDRPGRDNPHTHVILPGSFDSWADGTRLPLYMNRNKHDNHIELLHQIVQSEIARLLEREVGMDWEHRYDTWKIEINAHTARSILPEEEIAELTQDEPKIEPKSRWSGPLLDL